MAPSNTLVSHMEEKLLPKEKNKVSRALDRIGKAGPCSIQWAASVKLILHGKR